MPRFLRLMFFMLGCLSLGMLTTGCSNLRLVDTDVTAYATWPAQPPGPGTAYRFERLPSQQAPAAQQDTLEAAARTALAKVGLELKPQEARYGVQVVFNNQVQERYPYAGPYSGWGVPSAFLGAGNRGASIGFSFPLRAPEFWFKRELSLWVRDLSSGQVVFETRAQHDGVWADTPAVLPTMLDAALNGFPQPPAGMRRIVTEIPR